MAMAKCTMTSLPPSMATTTTPTSIPSNRNGNTTRETWFAIPRRAWANWSYPINNITKDSLGMTRWMGRGNSSLKMGRQYKASGKTASSLRNFDNFRR